jgi:alkylated DNA repair dioxygenase AlkB
LESDDDRGKSARSLDREIAASESRPQRVQPGRKRVPSDKRTLHLFDDDALPEGFKYEPDFLSLEEEHSLLQHIKILPFREFEFHGFTGKRRIVSFGWRYDFNGGGLTKMEDMPQFLSGVRARAENFAAIGSGELQQVLITEYSRGAAIGWHKDRSVFGDVVGISLLSPCTFRLRLKAGSLGAAQPDRGASLCFCCGVLPAANGSTAFRELTAFGTHSRSATFSKGLADHEPDVDITEAPAADARHAD